jgi:hypothetical protein
VNPEREIRPHGAEQRGRAGGGLQEGAAADRATRPVVVFGRHCPVCPFGIRIDSMTPARFRMGQNKKPQPETTPSRCPRAAALPLARRWTVRRHDPNGALTGSALQALCQVDSFVNFND